MTEQCYLALCQKVTISQEGRIIKKKKKKRGKENQSMDMFICQKS